MEVFTNSECHDMLLIYGEAQCSATRARELYMTRYPGKTIPNARSFVAVSRKYL